MVHFPLQTVSLMEGKYLKMILSWATCMCRSNHGWFKWSLKKSYEFDEANEILIVEQTEIEWLTIFWF